MEIIAGAREEVESKAVGVLVDAVKSCIEKKDVAVLGVPGGRSVRGLFAKLKAADVDWSRVHVFWVDERFVPLTDPQSNYQAAAFISKVPSENVHAFDYATGVEEYSGELRRVADGFDAVILGVGEDGHVASLFPNHPSIKSKSGWFIRVDDAPKPPSERVSASRRLLGRASVALVLFFGEAKRDAFEKFRDDAVSVEECPAKLALAVEKCYVLTDLRE